MFLNKYLFLFEFDVKGFNFFVNKVNLSEVNIIMVKIFIIICNNFWFKSFLIFIEFLIFFLKYKFRNLVFFGFELVILVFYELNFIKYEMLLKD